MVDADRMALVVRMTDLTWPCSTCGAPGARNIGTKGHCPRHLAALYDRFDPAVFQLRGIGWPGRSTCDTDLTCAACGATWTGIAGDACGWCAAAHAHLLAWQAEMLLVAPDTDPDDKHYEARMKSWANRLRRAVDTDLLTKTQAQNAWRKAATHARAA